MEDIILDETTEDEGNTLVDKIADAIESDDEVRSDLSLEIKKEYAAADKATKKAIDRIFIHLCGWSLDTLIHGQENINYNPFSRN